MKRAEKASPGPWEVKQKTYHPEHIRIEIQPKNRWDGQEMRPWETEGMSITATPDAEFIATADPGTVKGLLNLLERWHSFIHSIAHEDDMSVHRFYEDDGYSDQALMLIEEFEEIGS